MLQPTVRAADRVIKKPWIKKSPLVDPTLNVMNPVNILTCQDQF